MSVLHRIGLLPRVLIAIALGVLVGLVAPHWLVVVFATFNGVFSAFLEFIVPVLILALVAPAIGDPVSYTHLTLPTIYSV